MSHIIKLEQSTPGWTIKTCWLYLWLPVLPAGMGTLKNWMSLLYNCAPGDGLLHVCPIGSGSRSQGSTLAASWAFATSSTAPPTVTCFGIKRWCDTPFCWLNHPKLGGTHGRSNIFTPTGTKFNLCQMYSLLVLLWSIALKLDTWRKNLSWNPIWWSHTLLPQDLDQLESTNAQHQRTAGQTAGRKGPAPAAPTSETQVCLA